MDDVATVDNLNSNHCMIIDTEFETYPVRRLISIAYIIQDLNENKTIKEIYKIVKHNPSTFQINEDSESFKIHGITNMTCILKGEPLIDILEQWYIDLCNTNILLGHNLYSADISILRKECIGLNVWCKMYKQINKLKKIDTLPYIRNLKLPLESNSLNIVYQYFFNKKLEDHHNALIDCKATFEIYKYILENYQDLNYLDCILKTPEYEIIEMRKKFKTQSNNLIDMFHLQNSYKCDLCYKHTNDLYEITQSEYTKYNIFKYRLYCNFEINEGTTVCQFCYNNIEIIKYNDINEMSDILTKSIKKTNVKFKEYQEIKEKCFNKKQSKNIVLLKCPDTDKEECKKKGGKWNKFHQKWYIDIKQDSNIFNKWIITNE